MILTQNHPRGQIYRPLKSESKEIRVLLVGPGDDVQPVHCTIVYISLTDDARQSFETISYTWGDPKLRSTIYVDGHRLDVPASGERVLRRMRHSDRPRLLWLDAVSINQADLDERSQQVTIMHEIYGIGT